MYSANGNFYKNSHIIENMENDVAKDDDNVNSSSIANNNSRQGKGQGKGQSKKPILIKMLAIDSKNTYLDYIEYLPIDTLTDFDMLENPFINNLSEAPLIKKIIEFNIFFNIMNSTQNATNNTFTVKTNKQVTFEYNYINDNNVFNITKIKLGNDDLSKEPTEHIFTIHIKPKTIIRCKLTVMPTRNNNSGTPVIIINNLKTAIEQAGKLLI